MGRSAAETGATVPRPHLGIGRLGALALVLSLAAAGCGGDGPEVSGSPGPARSPAADAATPSPSPMTPGDREADLCRRVANLQRQVASLRSVELKLANRTALDIELDKVQAAFGELEQAELGMFEDQLEWPLRRLGYRLGEVELAVEDFRTNPRPRQAAPHVETDAETFSDELEAFAILARC